MASLDSSQLGELISQLSQKIGFKEVPYIQSARRLLDELRSQQKILIAQALVNKLESGSGSISLKHAFATLDFDEAATNIPQQIRDIQREVTKHKKLLDCIAEFRIKGKSQLNPCQGSQDQLLQFIKSYQNCMEFNQKYPSLNFDEYSSQIKSLQYWLKINDLIATLSTDDLIPSELLKEIMQNQPQQEFFKLTLEFLVPQNQKQKLLESMKQLKQILQRHMEWEKQLLAFQAYKMRLRQTLPFLKDSFNIVYLNSLIQFSHQLKTDVRTKITNLQKLTQDYQLLRDQGEAIILEIEKGEQFGNFEEKLETIVEKYHTLGVADDDEHYSPYVYKNCLLLINLKMILKVAQIVEKGESTEIIDVDDLERVLFQLKCTFNFQKSQSLKGVQAHEKWTLFIIPSELEESKNKIQEFEQFVNEIKELSQQLQDLHSKLTRFSGEKEAQSLGGFQIVRRMVSRATELSRFIEFDQSQLSDILKHVQRVEKIESEFIELREKQDLVPIKTYLDLYHSLRRLPFSLQETALEFKNLFVKTKAIKREVESTIDYFEENKMQSGLTLLSKNRVQTILDKYAQNRVSFTEGETLSTYLRESEQLYDRLNMEFLPRLEEIQANYDSLESKEYQKRGRKIKEAQGTLIDIDASLRTKMKIDFGQNFAKIQFNLFKKKYKFYVATIEQLLAEGDITLGSELSRQKIKPSISMLQQLQNEALSLQRSVLGSTKSELGTIQFHLSEAKLITDKLKRTFNRSDFNSLKAEIERGCVNLQQEVLEQGIKVNMHDPQPYQSSSKPSSSLQKRNSSQIGGKESFGLTDIISAMENKSGKTEEKEAERKREIGKKGPYFYASDRDNVKARVDARKHFEEILTGAKEGNPKPAATPIYMSNITRTQELAASLEKEAYNIRSKIDAGYDTLINRYSGPLVKLQHYPLIAQELIRGSNKLNILKICKQTVDLIFEEKLDNIESKLQRRLSLTNLPRRKVKEEQLESQPKTIETILEQTSQFQEKLKNAEEEAERKEAEETTERLQELYSEIRKIPVKEDDDADSLPSQPEAGQFSPHEETPKLVAKQSSTYEQIFQEQTFKEEKNRERGKEQEKSKQLYDPFSVLSALPQEEPVVEDGAPEQKGIFMLWEGMLMLGNNSTPIATCIYSLDTNKKLKQLAKFESAGTLRIKGRCKVEDILDYYRKNQHSRVQVRGWLHCELASAKQEEQYMNYYKELELTRKVGAIKLDSTNIYIFPWNDCTPELQRAWFNFDQENTFSKPRFGVLISHKQSMIGRPLDPIPVKMLNQEEYAQREQLASKGGEVMTDLQVPKQARQEDADEVDSLMSMPQQVVPQMEVQDTTLEQLKSVIIERLNQTGPDAEAQAEQVKQLFLSFSEKLPPEQIQELLEAIPERERALLTGSLQAANISPQAIPVEEMKSPEHVVDEKGSELTIHIEKEKRMLTGQVSQDILQDYEMVFMFMNQHCAEVKAKIIEVEKQRYNL